MMKFVALGLLATTAFAAPAFAQDEDNSIEPYVALMGAHHDFDSEVNEPGYPVTGPSSGLFEGVVGVNVPIGSSFFVGAEGFGAKGVKGPVDWEYGAAGRIGVRTGDGGLFYGKVGRRWVKFDSNLFPDVDVDDMIYGAGVEVGGSRFRVRAEIETFGDFHSIRPSMGVVMAF